MAIYSVQGPDGRIYDVEGPEGAAESDIIAAVQRQLLAVEKPKPKIEEPTVGGQVKEFAKGVIPGAIGMGQTALTGISALLPDETEKNIRQAVDRGAAALKAPFAAAPGYEETVGRKFGESVGSILPFLAMGPLGAVGRAGMVGMGVGAGAGEARIRAEQENATPEQRSTATALGTIPGAFEAFAPMQILNRLSTPIKAGITNRIQRALVAGGEEAAQEAASQIAQNLIAKGVYKPDQAIIEQVGESAAYGGATGALVQGIMDMAIGRRAKSTTQPQGQPAEQKLQTPVPAPEAAQIPEPTVRGEEPALETPEEIAAGPTAKAQAAQAKKLAAEQAAFLKQYEEQAALREQQAAEYERIKALSPEEYALEQMQGINAKKTKPASQEELNAQLAELGYQTEPTPPTPPVIPGADYAVQQIKLAKDREPVTNNKVYTSYLMQDPEQARLLVENQTPVPGVSEKDSNTILGGLKLQLTAYDKQQAQQKAQIEGAAQERARGLFAQQGADNTADFMAGAREQTGNAVVRPEIAALRRIGERPSPYLTANRDIEDTRKTEDLVDKLVNTLPLTNGKITPGDVFLGLGTKKQDVRDLQAQLAVARMTRNRTLQEDIKRQLDTTRAIPTEGGLGTEGGKTAAEFLGRSKMPELRAYEAEGDKFASEQRSTLLGMARVLASPKIMLPATRQKTLSDAKETYVAQHAAEIEARRKAFGFGPMEDWERAEARARALEGLNTLTNNWGRFEDPVISVKALQNITREAVYQNLYKTAQRRTSEEQQNLAEKTGPSTQKYYYEDAQGNRIEGKGMEVPRQTGPRIAAPDELTLKSAPNIPATDADAAQQFIEQVLSQVETKTTAPTTMETLPTREVTGGRGRVEPITAEKPAARVGDLASIATLFKEAKTGGRKVDTTTATVDLLESLRKGLRTNKDPEFVSLARQTAQKIAEGNLPSEYDVRDLGEMMKAYEAAGRSETRPGATSEELQRTSAQPQKELFPEASVQTQRATPNNFQKMLDSKDVQGMRDAIEKQRKENIEALQKVGKALPTLKNRLAKAEAKYKQIQKKAEAAGTEAYAYVSEYKTALKDAQDLVVVLRDELVILENQLKDVEITKKVLAQEPNDIRFLINAQKMLATETPLRRGVKLLESEVNNAKNLIAAVEASYKAQQTLVVPAQRRAEKTREELENAQAELSKVKGEANAANKRAERLAQADKEAKERAERELGTSREEFNKSAQAGREGLGLEGMRVQRDTTALKKRENELRSKLGSLEDQLDKAKSDKKKAAIQTKIDETTQELDALPSMAPAVRTDFGDRTATDLAFEAEQLKNARKLNTQLGLTAGLPAPIKGPIEKNIRTGRTTQGGQRLDRVGKSDAVTNALIARRGELSDINMRIGMLEQAKKPIPEKLTKLKDRAEKRVDKARKAQEAVAALEKETRSALSTANRKTIEAELKRAAEANEEPQFARGVETTSPDLTVSQVKALEDNNIRQAMNDIAADGNTSKLNQVVAQRLAAMLDNTDVKVERTLKDEAGKSVLGMATSKLVQLNRNGGLSQEILLHEGTHAATERVIVQYETDPSKLTEIQRVAVRELKALHNAIKNDPRITSASAKGSLSEFVAEVFSNKNLQDQLSQKKWRLSDAWKGFKSIIMRMLGVKDPETMLGAALQSVDALMVPSSNRTVGGKETAVSRRLSAKDIAALHTGSNSMKQFAEQFGTTAIKQKDRTAEDANRIGQDYLDDMYANPMDYVAPAEENKLDYSIRMSDGTDLDLDNPLHYVEADAQQLANLKAKKDASLRGREARSISKQRKTDLRELIKNMMDTPEFTFVEQALVAKAASKFAVLANKDGRLKLAAIEPNNRHNIAMVTSKDAASVIEELRAGKSLKQAFLDGMQKNADRNAELNESRNGWYKFDQSTSYKDAEKLSAAVAGTSWCTSGKAMAATQLKNGDFYVNYVNGNPSVAIRMDGQNKIGEVRGNTPSQALTAEQLKTTEGFLKSKNFAGADVYLDELDKKAFLQKVAKGETNFSPEDLINAENVLKENGDISDYRLDEYLSFDNIDGYYNLRPDAPKPVRDFFASKMKEDTVRAYEQGYFTFSEINTLRDISAKGTATVMFDGVAYETHIEDIKALQGLEVSQYQKEDKKKGTAFPALKNIGKLYMFSGKVDLPVLERVNDIVAFYGSTELSEIVVPKTTSIGALRPGKLGAFLTLRGAETVDEIKLRRGDSTLTLVAPDLKYAIIDTGLASYAESTAQKYIHALKDQVTKERGKDVADAFDDFDMYWDHAVVQGDDTSAVVEATGAYNQQLLKAVDNALPSALFEKFDADLNANDEFVEQSPYKNIDDVASFLFARATDEEYAALYFREIVQDVYPNLKLPELGSNLLTAPKFVGERPVVETTSGKVEQEVPRYARAQATGFEAELATASELIAKPTTVREKVEANLGLAFRTQVLDRLAPLEKVAAEQMDAFKGMQMMYYLRMADQKMSFVQQSVGRGVPQIVEKKRADGNVERLIESQNGPNLVNVVTTLKAAPGMNAQAANQLFTLYLAAKRADRVGYDVLNFGASEASIKSAVAKIEANKELRDVFEKARGQYNEYNRDLVKFLEDTGAITPEEAARLAKTNDYIPYYREQNGNAVLVIGGEGTFKVGNLTDQPQLRQLIGGNEKILDFLTSSVQNTSMIMDMGLRNQAAKNAMFELADLSMAQFLGGNPSGPDIVRFKDKGVEKYVRIDTAAAGIPADLLVKGMEGIPVNNSAIVKVMGGFSTLLRRSITVSPLYSARQVFRDSVAAPLLSGADFVPVFGALKQIGNSATREKLESRGIVGGQILTGTNEDLTRILGELQSGKMGIGQFIAKAEAFAMEADALTRRAQYDSYIKQGLSEMEATLMSLESMNFNRKGLSPSARFATTVIPFFNAQLQSLDVLYRSVTGKMPMSERLDIQGKLLRRGALLASLSVAYALMMQDDETYKNANPDEKYNNFFVHVPGIKEAIRVPIPFEIGYIFKSLPEAIVNTMNSEKGGEEAYKAFKNIAIQTVPGGTSLFLPAALKPIVENVSGFSFFTGRSLETKREQMQQAEYRYRDNTSELAKQVGAVTGTSPIKIENLIRGYTGSMGVALAQAFDFAMPTSGTPEQATKRLSDAAVIGPLFQPEDAGGIVGAVYDRLQTITETKRTYDNLLKSGQRAEAMEFLQRNMDDYAKSAIAGNVQQQLAKVTQAINAVKASNMSPDEKRESLDRLQQLRINLAASVRGAL